MLPGSAYQCILGDMYLRFVPSRNDLSSLLNMTSVFFYMSSDLLADQPESICVFVLLKISRSLNRYRCCFIFIHGLVAAQ